MWMNLASLLPRKAANFACLLVYLHIGNSRNSPIWQYSSNSLSGPETRFYGHNVSLQSLDKAGPVKNEAAYQEFLCLSFLTRD